MAAPHDLDDRFVVALEQLDDNLRVGQGSSVKDLSDDSPLGERLADVYEVLELLHRYYDGSGHTIEKNRLEGLPPRLGRYDVIRVLGRGGMGVVLEARHTALKRLVALKVIKGVHAPDASLVRRFTREMEAVGRVDHPNVIRASDAGEENGILFLAMDLLDGVTVEQLIRAQGRLTVADTCEIARQIALGLAAIDAKGLVHRDMKPSNVMVTRDGVVKILDLGLARIRNDDVAAEERTPSGVLLGTFDYQAPEQAGHAHAVTIQADLYSLGCTIFKMLTGSAPFAASKTPAQKIQAHDSRPLPELPAAVPKSVQAIVAQLAEKPPQRRGTPTAIAETLAVWAKGADLRTLVAASSGTSSALPVQAEIDTAPSHSDTAESPRSGQVRRRSRIWVGAVALAVATLLTIAYFTIPREGAIEPKPATLDTQEPGKLLDLLSRSPKLSPWSAQAELGSWTYDANKATLQVYAARTSLLTLGQLNRPNFDFSVLIHQPTWTEGAGIFFDFQETEAIDAKGESWRVAQFQSLNFSTLQHGPDKPRRFMMSRSTHHWKRSAAGKEEKSSTRIRDADIPTPLGDQALAIKVRSGNIEEVRLDNAPLPSLVIEAGDRPIAGELGVMCVTSTASFRNAYLKVFEAR